MEERGYTRVRDPQADLTVAYYIGSKNKLQVTDYNYGYPFWGWRGLAVGRPVGSVA